MKVLSVCFIKFLILLKVYAFEQDALYAVPDTVMSEILHLDTTLNNPLTGDLLFSKDINEYWLYSSENPTEGQRLVHKDIESVKNSNFDKNKKTLFQIHGWVGDYQSPLNKNMTKAVLSSTDAINWNVIRVDWSKNAKLTYESASISVRKVGQHVCDFIRFLLTQGLSFLDTVLVGHSLGAHVAGFAGRTCDCALAMIIALDPGGPLWATHPEKVSKKDARYVAVTHTSLFLGDYYHLMGHVDFYPNGGKEMPTCGSDFRCNHNMAARYWCASWHIPEKFVANRCDSMDQMEKDKCNGTAGLYVSSKPDNRTLGIMRLNTTELEFPFY